MNKANNQQNPTNKAKKPAVKAAGKASAAEPKAVNKTAAKKSRVTIQSEQKTAAQSEQKQKTAVKSTRVKKAATNKNSETAVNKSSPSKTRTKAKVKAKNQGSSPGSKAGAPSGSANQDEKIQKVLARHGLGSRREMETWISAGRVEVNGNPAKLGDRISAADQIRVDGRALNTQQANDCRVILYNKPEGQVCSHQDDEGRPRVFDYLPKLKNQRWISVGRLDINTSGLLLFTTDGELANKLMHPSSNIDREYVVRVRGEVDDAMLKRLTEGVLLDDGPARFTDIKPSEETSEGSNQWFYVALMEGRNREVRRLWESQGVTVSRLKRVRFGPIFIPSDVVAGRWRELEQDDLNTLREAAGLAKVKAAEPLRTRFNRGKKKTPHGSVNSARHSARKHIKPR